MMGKNEVHDDVYDWTSERPTVMTLGCINIVKKPRTLFYVNVAYLFLIISLYTYLMIMAAVTIFISEGMIRAHVIRALSTMGSVVLIILLTFKTKKELSFVNGLVKRGVYQYSEDGIRQELLTVKAKRVRQIRFFVPLLTYACYCNLLAHGFLLPLVNYLFVNVEAEVDYLSPYLPLPVYMPFRTDTLLGFSFAFLLNGVFWFLLTSVYTAHIEVTLSVNLQLCTQIEVLNYYIVNIKKRAYYRYSKSEKASLNPRPEMDNQDLQSVMYDCLRENILHHHAILRYKEVITNYIGGINFVALVLYSIILGSSLFVFLEEPGNVTVIVKMIQDFLGFFQLCLTGQVITNESAASQDSLYFTPWTECSAKIKRLLCILITNTQSPITLRDVVFNVPLSLETFSNMISASYKIINVLR